MKRRAHAQSDPLGAEIFLGAQIGYWRNVLPEVCVIESRPVYSKENYRLADPFPELAAFATKYGLDTVQHPHIANTERQEGPRRWVDGAGVEVVPKAHSHIPCFVILLKAMEMWKASHGGKAPKTDAEKVMDRPWTRTMQTMSAYTP